MNPDPRQIMHDLGMDPVAIKHVDTMSEENSHALWRIVTPEKSYILKWLPEADARIEINGYLLLQELGVPTLPLYGCTAQALLLEDLTRSDRWRLAIQADTARAEVGGAVARWYRIFHNAGEALLSHRDCPSFLRRETDELEPDNILAAGRALGLANYHVWDLACKHIELLKAAVEKLSITLNYNDFHWTNLALSRREGDQLEAITFDYHLLGVGMRYSDCRNVVGSLSGDAVNAFWDTYGYVDLREAELDRPLADLYTFYVASRMSKFPKWAQDSRERVINGDLEKDLISAIEVALSLYETTA
jgi:hypothetical protein